MRRRRPRSQPAGQPRGIGDLHSSRGRSVGRGRPDAGGQEGSGGMDHRAGLYWDERDRSPHKSRVGRRSAFAIPVDDSRRTVGGTGAGVTACQVGHMQLFRHWIMAGETGGGGTGRDLPLRAL